ncbi:MAG: hypothetical protein MUF64_11255 [Polyangiaceae bacterium]|nr:hypothetical protein [Polyangiaceae bacterium]
MPLADLPPLPAPSLWLGTTRQPELSLGAFQRASSALSPSSLPRTRRLSGGPSLFLPAGSLHLALFLPSPSALVQDADLPRFLNRHVRPLLRALRSLGLLASYPGRDWIAVAHRPVAWIGFAHLASSGACCFEAFLPLETSFSLPDGVNRYPAPESAPWLGKSPASLREVSATPLDLDRLQDAVLRAYRGLDGEALPRAPFTDGQLRPEAQDERPPWQALREEVIGYVGASGPPSAGLGGDFFASEDLIRVLDQRLATLPRGTSRGELREAVAAVLEETGGHLEGVRSVSSLLDALEEAFR